MRIALIGPAVPDQGGAARHTTELAYRLAAAGHNVVIESWRAPGPAAPNPADPAEFPRTHRRLAWYRPDSWIAAGRRLRSADLVVFALESQAQTHELLAALGLGTRVTLRPDYVPAAGLPALFAAADALVLPYRAAAGSQNVLLAFSSGVPVIATTAGALAEAVRDGVDGLTCAPGDVDDLARALNQIADPRTLSQLRSGVRRVDPEPYWSAYLHALGVRP